MLKKTSLMSPESVVIQTPFTRLGLIFDSGILLNVDLFCEKKLSQPRSKQAMHACQQIQDYCSKDLAELKFDIELKMTGTVFQKKVWQALQQIPPGKVMAYGELAQQLKTSARAVGNACRANPVPLVIPCHRIVAKTGLGGFSGSRDVLPMQIKTWLLRHEGISI